MCKDTCTGNQKHNTAHNQVFTYINKQRNAYNWLNTERYTCLHKGTTKKTVNAQIYTKTHAFIY